MTSVSLDGRHRHVKITRIERGLSNVFSHKYKRGSPSSPPPMSTFLNGLAYLSENYGPGSAALILILCTYLILVWRAKGAAVRKIPGPPSPSWIFGNMLQLMRPHVYGDYEFEWRKLYGPVYRVKGCFGENRLMVSDPASLQFILNSPHFGVGPTLKIFLYLLFGEKSVVGATESDHKRLRAALNPGFNATFVRSYLPVFEKAAQAFAEQLDGSCNVPTNFSPLLSRATLGTISEVLLGYSEKELGEEFVSHNTRGSANLGVQSPARILVEGIGGRLPLWWWRAVLRLPIQAFRHMRANKRVTEEIGARNVREKKHAAQQGLEIDTDIYGRLLTQNRSANAKNPLDDDYIVAQTGIIVAAGQDTTASTLAFALRELAKTPALQDKLRTEIHLAPRDDRSGGRAYENMPFLNAFIKEILRMYPALPISERIAVCDTVIPLSSYIKTSTGEIMSQIPVRKGQIVAVAIASYHQDKGRWGEDASEFNPMRWLDGTISKGEAALGPYANLLSFLGGPRTCLGWRFAVLQVQVFICALVEKFSFTLPEGDAVRIRLSTTLLPVMANGKKGAPLCIKPVV
ncbi:cytochrome P450 [Mycena capillaripes]|nr:cytochrome P450 [Mycena capillaripes]